jgi:hypothetical protein
MIYKDPLANRTAEYGRWFAWHPVQLDYENRTAWLTHVYRKWIEAGGWGCYVYASREDLL